jgi:hypothetical protein
LLIFSACVNPNWRFPLCLADPDLTNNLGWYVRQTSFNYNERTIRTLLPFSRRPSIQRPASAAHAEVGGGRRVTDGYPTYGRCGSRSSCVSSRGAMLNTENPQLTFGTQSCTEGIRRGGVTLLTPPIHAESNSSRGRRSSRQHNTALALITVPDFSHSNTYMEDRALAAAPLTHACGVPHS